MSREKLNTCHDPLYFRPPKKYLAPRHLRSLSLSTSLCAFRISSSLPYHWWKVGYDEIVRPLKCHLPVKIWLILILSEEQQLEEFRQFIIVRSSNFSGGGETQIGRVVAFSYQETNCGICTLHVSYHTPQRPQVLLW